MAMIDYQASSGFNGSRADDRDARGDRTGPRRRRAFVASGCPKGRWTRGVAAALVAVALAVVVVVCGQDAAAAADSRPGDKRAAARRHEGARPVDAGPAAPRAAAPAELPTLPDGRYRPGSIKLSAKVLS